MLGLGYISQTVDSGAQYVECTLVAVCYQSY